MNKDVHQPIYLLPQPQQTFDVVEFVEGIAWSKVIYVEPLDLLSNAVDKRIVELEKAELDSAIGLLLLLLEALTFLGWYGLTIAFPLKLCKDFICTVDNSTGHASQFGNVDTETVFRATGHEFAQKYDFARSLTHRDVEVLYAVVLLLHIVELMIVRSKESFGLRPLIIMEELDNGPGE